jgi:predicted nucleic acid-binding protein
VSSLVLDASSAVELLARTTIGHLVARLVPRRAVLWVPDGLFDVEVHAVLRRWDLRSVLTPNQVAACRLRLAALRLRRAAVSNLAERAWQLRANMTFSDACYVALAEALGCPLLTADLRLASTPNLPVSTLHL